MRRDQHSKLLGWALPFAVVWGCCSFTACSPTVDHTQRISKSGSPIGAENLSDDADRLEQLRLHRESDSFADKLAIGPGDVIEVTVPRVAELNKFRVRVSENNTVSIPLAGVVSVAGMTEEELREELYKRLAKPMKNPDVQVFVVQYQSRDVAVVGMVRKAGLYTIASREDTVLSMINRAGGMEQQASSRVLFIPASPSLNRDHLIAANSLSAPVIVPPGKIQNISTDSGASERQSPDLSDRVVPDSVNAGALLDSTANENHLLSLLGATDPIEINLTSAKSESQLDVPVRPGDTIIVPAAGEVMVDGWVRNPGAFHIVPGMTAISAVSAAGGALFSHSAEVLRADTDGTRRSIGINLAQVEAGNEPDVPVREGDIVVVKHSPVGAVPYAFYEMFTKFGTGMYLPVP